METTKEPYHKSKPSKLVDGKKLFFVLDSESYRNLKNKSKEKNLTMTKFLEMILKEKRTENTANISKIYALTNLNQKFYMDINATFSNLNQIAYNLNLDKFFEESTIDKEFLENLFDELQKNRESIQEFRLLILEFLLYLEADSKKHKQIQNKIKAYQKKYKDEYAKSNEKGGFNIKELQNNLNEDDIEHDEQQGEQNA